MLNYSKQFQCLFVDIIPTHQQQLLHRCAVVYLFARYNGLIQLLLLLSVFVDTNGWSGIFNFVIRRTDRRQTDSSISGFDRFWWIVASERNREKKLHKKKRREKKHNLCSVAIVSLKLRKQKKKQKNWWNRFCVTQKQKNRKIVLS